MDSDDGEEEDEEDGDDEKDESNDSESEKDEFSKSKNMKTKLAPLPEEEDSKKKHYRINRMKKQALNSSLVKDLRKEYSEAPDEIIERQEYLGTFYILN